MGLQGNVEIYYIMCIWLNSCTPPPLKSKSSLKSDSSFRVSKMTFPKGHWTPHEADCLDPRRIFIQAPFIFLLLEHVLSINPTPKTITKILHTCLLCFPTYMYIYTIRIHIKIIYAYIATPIFPSNILQFFPQLHSFWVLRRWVLKCCC